MLVLTPCNTRLHFQAFCNRSTIEKTKSMKINQSVSFSLNILIPCLKRLDLCVYCYSPVLPCKRFCVYSNKEKKVNNKNVYCFFDWCLMRHADFDPSRLNGWGSVCLYVSQSVCPSIRHLVGQMVGQSVFVSLLVSLFVCNLTCYGKTPLNQTSPAPTKTSGLQGIPVYRGFPVQTYVYIYM